MKLKSILVLALLTLLLTCCAKKPKQEFIPILEHEGIMYYVATPSGVIYQKATDSEYVPYINEMGETININAEIANQ